MAAKRTLNVKRTNQLELAKRWNIDIAVYPGKQIFVRCNSKGEVKWETTLVYPLSELLMRGNVNVIE